jgi:hypothetical protein
MKNDISNTLLTFFKALANEKRLRILSLLASRECNVVQLSAFLKLRPPTVSHHLNVLKNLDLVKMRKVKNDHLYCLNSDGLYGVRREILTAIAPEKRDVIIDEKRYDFWEKKVLNTFIDGDRIKFIPAVQKKKLVVLRWLVNYFEKGREYTEKEVNEIISSHHPDYCSFRRYLVDFGYMERKEGIYQRTKNIFST